MSGAPSPEKKISEAKRHISILDRSLAGPVASVWMTHLFGFGPMPTKSEAVETESSIQQSAAKFTVSQTEHAIDSVLPCAAEEWLRPIMHSKFSNPAKMQFQYNDQ